MGVRIPKALVENYARTIGTLSDSACKAVARQMAGFTFSDDVAADRTRIQSLLKAALRPYMDVSVRTTVEFYNIVREWSLGERLDEEVSVDEVERPDATDGAVRAFMQQAVAGTPENIAQMVVDRTAYELKRSAMDTMLVLGAKDEARVKFARVPGFSAAYGDGCSFCKMLASRGFVYLSKDTAETHVHNDCRCTVVPGFKGDTVEGYNPDEIGEQWEKEMNDLAEARAAKNGTTSQEEYDLIKKGLAKSANKAKLRNKLDSGKITKREYNKRLKYFDGSAKKSAASKPATKPAAKPAAKPAIEPDYEPWNYGLDELFDRPKTSGSIEYALSGANKLDKRRNGDLGYKRNCQRCVVAVELRRRGYDVVAMPAREGDGYATVFWDKLFKDAEWKPASNKREADALIKAMPVGSRGTIDIMWTPTKGHVFNFERTSNGVRYYDGQTGDDNVSRYFRDRCKGTDLHIARTDNLEVDFRFIDEVVENAKGKMYK